jgi:hypothetical protein
MYTATTTTLFRRRARCTGTGRPLGGRLVARGRLAGAVRGADGVAGVAGLVVGFVVGFVVGLVTAGADDRSGSDVLRPITKKKATRPTATSTPAKAKMRIGGLRVTVTVLLIGTGWDGLDAGNRWLRERERARSPAPFLVGLDGGY